MRLRYWPVVFVCLSVGTSCAKSPEAARDAYLASGKTYFDRQQYREAIVEFQNAANADAKSGEARNRLSEAYERLGNMPAAFREAVRAADLLPDRADLQVRAGQMMLAAGQYEDARTRAERVLSKTPKDVQAQLLLANALAGLNNIDAAVKQVKEAIQIDPNEVRSYANLGVLELARGKNVDAEAAFKRAIEIAPKNPTPHVALANFYWSVGQRDRAESELKAAADLDPNDPDVNQAYGAFLVATQRMAEAERYFAASAKGGDPVRQLALVDYYILARRWPDAERVLKGVEDTALWRPVALTKLAGVRYLQNRKTEADALLSEVLKQQPKNAEALVNRARLRADSGHLEEALVDARGAIAADPSSAQAQYVLGLIQSARRDYSSAKSAFNEVLKLNPRAAAAQVQLARVDLATGRPEPSVQLAEQAIASAPQNLGARVIFVRALVAKGELRRAATELNMLLKAAPWHASVQETAGYYYTATKNFDEARRAFTKALEANPDSPLATHGLLNLDLIAGHLDDARQRADAAMRDHPQNAEMFAAAADAFIAMNALDRAEPALKRQLALDPNAFDAYEKLARIYIAQNRLDDARREFDKVAAREQRSSSAATMSAMILQVQNKPAEAKAKYKEIVQLDPGAAVAANNLAYYYALDNEHLDEALTLAQSAKAGQPDNPEFSDTLGFVYYRKGLQDLAIEALRTAVEARPNRADYAYHLGLAYEGAGRYKEAREALSRSIQLAPQAADAAHARELVGQIDQRIGTR